MQFERLHNVYKRLRRTKPGKAIPAPPDEHVEILKLNDVFSPLARAHRRNLLAACVVALLLVALNQLKFDREFIIDLNDPRSHWLAAGALGLLSIYECISFLAYGVRDLQAWKLNLFEKLADYELKSQDVLRERIEGVYLYLRQIAHNADTAGVNLADVLRHQNELPQGTFDQLNDIAKNYNEDVTRLKDLTSSYNKWGIVQLVVLDWLLPIVLFWLVPYKTMPGILDLLGAIL